MYAYKQEGITVGQLFSLETELTIHKEVFMIPKTL